MRSAGTTLWLIPRCGLQIRCLRSFRARERNGARCRSSAFSSNIAGSSCWCVLPLLAAAIGLAVYLMGGRYISTDNAYVGAQKVLITPNVAGKINRIDVIEGQQVEPGDLLFEIDPIPFSWR